MENKDKKLNTGYYLVKILRSILREEKILEIPKDISIQVLYQMAKRHSVDCMAYAGVAELLENDDSEYVKKWKKQAMLCATQGIVQLRERDMLYRMFQEAGVRILPLKGCLLKEMYPKQEYRQMADLDILVDDENCFKVKAIMESAGYESSEDFGHSHHDVYVKKPWCSVEIHRSLLYETLKNAKKYDDVWEYAYEIQPDSGIYRLTWEDFYIYMLEHFTKHLYSGGCGIRFVMDVHVFLKFLKNEKLVLDQEKLEKRLRELELWEFRNLAEVLAENWFEKGIIGQYPEIEELIIVSGIYGTKEQDYRSTIEKLNKKYHSYGAAKIAYVGGKVFLRYKQMCFLYPFLKKYPILLPACWIHRILKTVLKKHQEIKKFFQFIRRAEKQEKSCRKSM